jgi:uncharacterized protein (TIGR02598 family)
MGIIVFSMVTMLGLMPVGLETLRESRESIVFTQIAEQVSNDLQQIPFDQVDAYIAAGVLSFDEDGALSGASTGNENRTIYQVTLAKKSSSTFPGSANAVDLANNFLTLELSITHTSRPDSASTTFVHISNQGG